MNILEALFSGAKAFVKEIVSVARTVVREVLIEIDQSAFGKSATRLVDGITDRYFSEARSLAEEEIELAAAFLETHRYAALKGGSMGFTKMEGTTVNIKDKVAYSALANIQDSMIEGKSSWVAEHNIKFKSYSNPCFAEKCLLSLNTNSIAFLDKNDFLKFSSSILNSSA